MSNRSFLRRSAIACLLSILCGCGQKGGLYLPDEAPAKVRAKPSAAAPATPATTTPPVTGAGAAQPATVPAGTPPADDPATRRKAPPPPDPSTSQ